jgi:hypothetical protein
VINNQPDPNTANADPNACDTQANVKADFLAFCTCQ